MFMLKLKKKKLLAIAVAFSLMIGSAMPISYAGTDGAAGQERSEGGSNGGGSQSGSSNGGMSNVSLGIQLAMGVAGGIPISGNVKYSFTNLTPAAGGQVIPICTGTKSPTQNETASYKCIITGMAGGRAAYGVAMPVSKTVKGGDETFETEGVYRYYNPTAKKYEMGVMGIEIKINGYKGQTTMSGSSPYDIYNTELTNTLGNNTLTYDENTLTNASDYNNIIGAGSDICPDGTYFCMDTNTTSTLFPDNTTETNGTNGTNGINGTDGLNGTNGGSGYYYPYDDDDDNNYGNLLNDLLGDNGYNSGDSDWANSGEGEDGLLNLDNYFNDTEGNDTLPGGLTDDILGVDDELLQPINNTGYNVGDPVDLDGDGVPDGIAVDVNGDGIPDGVDVDGDGVPDYPLPTGSVNLSVAPPSEDYYDTGSSGYGYEEEVPDGYNSGGDGFYDISGNLQDLLAMADGVSDDSNGDSSFKGLNEEGSLAARIEALMKPSNTEASNPEASITEQELFDIAKKMLIANGMSVDDIAKGKNYDKGSAYTEPMKAWDMNRITTLLKGKKIKLDAGEVQKKEEKNTLTNTSTSATTKASTSTSQAKPEKK